METKISRNEIRKRFNINEDEIVFIYWGRILPEKGVYELIKAYKNMRNQNDNTKLLIMGNASFGYGGRSSYDTKIEDLCNDENIKDIFV